MNWKLIPKDIEPYQGMIYLITNTENGKRYIGKKNFWTKRKLKPLKGQKRRRIKRVETDWRTYYGSSKYLTEEVNSLGKGKFKRECLALCYNKWQLSYYEGFFQYQCEVLLSNDWYNGLIALKCHAPRHGYSFEAPKITTRGRQLLK